MTFGIASHFKVPSSQHNGSNIVQSRYELVVVSMECIVWQTGSMALAVELTMGRRLFGARSPADKPDWHFVAKLECHFATDWCLIGAGNTISGSGVYARGKQNTYGWHHAPGIPPDPHPICGLHHSQVVSGPSLSLIHTHVCEVPLSIWRPSMLPRS